MIQEEMSGMMMMKGIEIATSQEKVEILLLLTHSKYKKHYVL